LINEQFVGGHGGLTQRADAALLPSDESLEQGRNHPPEVAG
jgi:hypothetical protein